MGKGEQPAVVEVLDHEIGRGQGRLDLVDPGLRELAVVALSVGGLGHPGLGLGSHGMDGRTGDIAQGRTGVAQLRRQLQGVGRGRGDGL